MLCVGIQWAVGYYDNTVFSWDASSVTGTTLLLPATGISSLAFTINSRDYLRFISMGFIQLELYLVLFGQFNSISSRYR